MNPPTGERQQDALVTHLLPHQANGLINEGRGGPIGITTANVINEIADQGHAAGGMDHLGVELHPVELARQVRHRHHQNVDSERGCGLALARCLTDACTFLCRTQGAVRRK